MGPTCADVHTPTSNRLGPSCPPAAPPPPSSNLWTPLCSPAVNSSSIWQPWQVKALAPSKRTACPLTNATSTASGRTNEVVAL